MNPFPMDRLMRLFWTLVGAVVLTSVLIGGIALYTVYKP